MRYITVRDLNTKPKEVWEKIKEADVIVTSNGKPIAILTGATEATLENQLRALAMEDLQKTAADKGLDRWPEKKIEDEIRAVRKTRRT
jgi:antitoxin (DNA-binding transcriptional repressor) of toxin-antitoxin stability system